MKIGLLAAAQLIQAVLMQNIVNNAMAFLKEAVVDAFCGIVLTMVIEVFVSAVIERRILLMKEKKIYHLRKELLGAMLSARYSEVSQYGDGDFISILNSDVESIGEHIRNVVSLGYLPVKVAAAIIVCFVISWKVTV